MRRLGLAVLCLSLAPAVFAAAGRHLILEPQHVLTAAEVSQLAAEGIEVQRPLTNGRYLVRVAPNARLEASDVRVRSLRAIDPDEKLAASARRSLATAKPAAQLSVMFHDDVTFDAARATILAAGGSLVSPLTTQFGMPRLVRAYVPAAAATALAGDENVLSIRAAFKLRPRPDNATNASLSNVTPLYSAPYGLSGEGVTLALFELGPAFLHNDFGGRLTRVNFETCNDFYNSSECADLTRHATHVAGTMIGSGAGNAAAKGMAPSARIFQFDAGGLPEEYLPLKANQVAVRGASADNNSWGYEIGWAHDGSRWIWQDNEEYFGAYEATVVAPLDVIARSTDVLAVHSSGNDGTKFGPQSAPFQHMHVDDDLEVIENRVFCYSSDGTGNDCPSTCTGGCERVRHPVNAPFRSVGITASAKNILTVGATDGNRVVAGYSSRGPAADGRIKPEIVARGGTEFSGVFSTLPNNSYGTTNGTSMSTPTVTGITALLTEQWKRFTGGANPSGQMLKAVLLATADDLGNPGPDYSYGFGFANAKAAVDLLRDDANGGTRIRMGTIAHGARVELPLAINTSQTLRVLVTWPDPDVLIFDDAEFEIASVALVNDLDLKVIDPSGAEVLPYVLDKTTPTAAATRGVNAIDNTELVEIRNAVPGNYKIVLTAKIRDNREATQKYVIVSNGAIGATAAPCTDVHEPNDTADQAYGLIPSGQTVSARNCAATDVDYYRFRVDGPGLVRVSVTATDTPLRVRLSNNQTADIPAGGTSTLQFEYAATTAAEFNVRIEPNGPLGASARYTLTATFPSIRAPRTRATR
jgi:hypothetical protein